jgi:hypothetical protein
MKTPPGRGPGASDVFEIDPPGWGDRRMATEFSKQQIEWREPFMNVPTAPDRTISP